MNIKKDPAPVNEQHFFIVTAINNDGFYLKMAKGPTWRLIQFYVADSKPGGDVFTTGLDLDGKAPEGTWNYYVFTYEFNNPADPSSLFTLYLNGSPESLHNPINFGPVVSSGMATSLMLGGPGMSGATSNLHMDEVCIFDGILTHSQVAELYQLYQLRG